MSQASRSVQFPQGKLYTEDDLRRMREGDLLDLVRDAIQQLQFVAARLEMNVKEGTVRVRSSMS